MEKGLHWAASGIGITRALLCFPAACGMRIKGPPRLPLPSHGRAIGDEANRRAAEKGVVGGTQADVEMDTDLVEVYDIQHDTTARGPTAAIVPT